MSRSVLPMSVVFASLVIAALIVWRTSTPEPEEPCPDDPLTAVSRDSSLVLATGILYSFGFEMPDKERVERDFQFVEMIIAPADTIKVRIRANEYYWLTRDRFGRTFVMAYHPTQGTPYVGVDVRR